MRAQPALESDHGSYRLPLLTPLAFRRIGFSELEFIYGHNQCLSIFELDDGEGSRLQTRIRKIHNRAFRFCVPG
jgi:hypothetical protein